MTNTNASYGSLIFRIILKKEKKLKRNQMNSGNVLRKEHNKPFEGINQHFSEFEFDLIMEFYVNQCTQNINQIEITTNGPIDIGDSIISMLLSALDAHSMCVRLTMMCATWNKIKRRPREEKTIMKPTATSCLTERHTDEYWMEICQTMYSINMQAKQNVICWESITNVNKVQFQRQYGERQRVRERQRER